MPRLVLANQATATRRRCYFHLVDATDGITAETGEAGGQPQISTNGGAFTGTGIGTLSAIGTGRYFADVTQAAVATAGDVIETRFKSAATAETPGDTFQVVAFDPDAAADLGLSNLDAQVSLIPTTAMRGTDGVDTATMRGTDGALTDKAGFSLSVAGILAVWHQLLTAIVTAGSIGKLIKDNLNAPVGSIPTTAMRGTDGVDTATMRGTDGANTTTPPTVTQIDTELTSSHGSGAWTTGSGGAIVEVDGGFGLDKFNSLSGLVWVEDAGVRRTDFNSPTVSTVVVTLERDTGSVTYTVTPTVDAARGLIHFAGSVVLPDDIPVLANVKITFSDASVVEGGIPITSVVGA